MHKPKERAERGPQKIEAMYAWIATEPDGGEGLVSIYLPHVRQHMPLIGADMKRVVALRPHAEQVHASTGCPVRLVAFRGPVEVLEVLGDG